MPGYDFDSWLTSHAVYANAAPVLRDRLTCGELVGWLGGDGLDAAQRRGIADAALECVDALTLAALDAMAGDDADALAGDLDWPAGSGIGSRGLPADRRRRRAQAGDRRAGAPGAACPMAAPLSRG